MEKRSKLNSSFADCDFNLKIDKKYGGKWIVIINGKIFGAGRRAESILKKARKEHPDKIPFVYQVPTQDSMLL